MSTSAHRRLAIVIASITILATACFAPPERSDQGEPGGLLGSGDETVDTATPTTLSPTPCESAELGLTLRVVPDGWRCRHLDPAGGAPGFVLHDVENDTGLEFSVGAPADEPTPCEAFEVCDDVRPFDAGPDLEMTTFEVVGVTIVFGTHVPSGVDIGVTAARALTPDDRTLIREVLAGVATLESSGA